MVPGPGPALWRLVTGHDAANDISRADAGPTHPLAHVDIDRDSSKAESWTHDAPSATKAVPEMRRLVAALAVTLGLVTTAGCEAGGRNTATGNVSDPRPVYCTIMADGPIRNADKATSIVARTRFRCDNPGADVLTLAVTIERRAGSTWAAAKSETFAVRGADTHARFLKYRSRQLTVACGPGQFRTTVAWTKMSRGRTSTGTVRGGPTKDPCAPRIFS